MPRLPLCHVPKACFVFGACCLRGCLGLRGTGMREAGCCIEVALPAGPAWSSLLLDGNSYGLSCSGLRRQLLCTALALLRLLHRKPFRHSWLCVPPSPAPVSSTDGKLLPVPRAAGGKRGRSGGARRGWVAALPPASLSAAAGVGSGAREVGLVNTLCTATAAGAAAAWRSGRAACRTHACTSASCKVQVQKQGRPGSTLEMRVCV